jgi:Fe2+ or Zn2+ uptake regulation protein
MSLTEIKNEHQRRSILKALSAMVGFGANHSMVRETCASFGVGMSNDTIKTQLYWLEEQGLISIKTQGNYLLAELKARGQDVVDGLVFIPGIKRPSAGE